MKRRDTLAFRLAGVTLASAMVCFSVGTMHGQAQAPATPRLHAAGCGGDATGCGGTGETG